MVFKKGNKVWLGKHHTEETKEKISKAHKGKIPWNINIPRTKKTKRKISEANKGHIPWNKGLKNFNKKEYNEQYYIKNKEKVLEQGKQYRIKNKEKRKKQKKQYYLSNRELILEKEIKYRKNNPEKIKEISKRYRENNIEYINQWREKFGNEYQKQWRIDNPGKDRQSYQKHREKRLEYCKQWTLNNYEKMKKYRKQWSKDNRKRRNELEKNRNKIDLKYNLNRKMKTAIGLSLKGNKGGKKWLSLVDYSLIELILHLKSTMPEGYNWNNFLKGKLHIDHIIPKKVFNFTKPEHIDFKRCWALRNLQLLPAKENYIKNDKLEKPFQPALKI